MFAERNMYTLRTCGTNYRTICARYEYEDELCACNGHLCNGNDNLPKKYVTDETD